MPYMCVVKGCNHDSKSHKGICGFYRIPRVKENERGNKKVDNHKGTLTPYPPPAKEWR